MTYTQRAIEDAANAGWETSDIHCYSGKETIYYYRGINDKSERINPHAILLDPQFWRALGKAQEGQEMLDGGINYDESPTYDIGWKVMWHRLIDHLSEDKDIESFFRGVYEDNEK